MANETSEDEEVTQLEASFGEAIEKQNWVQYVNDQVPFRCLVKAKGKNAHMIHSSLGFI